MRRGRSVYKLSASSSRRREGYCQSLHAVAPLVGDVSLVASCAAFAGFVEQLFRILNIVKVE